MIILYEKPYVRITYLPQHRLLEVHWLSEDMSSADFRDGHWQAITLAERYQTRNWLASFTAIALPTAADIEWLNQQWFPRYIALELDKIALIRPPQASRRQQLTEVARQADAAGHTNRPDSVYFDDLEAAREWVRKPLTTGQLPSDG